MKRLVPTCVIAAVIAFPAFAEQQHEHGDSAASRTGGMMMNPEQMTAMHEHMQEMHELMTKINTETDPEKRRQLMQEHMQAMLDGMGMMSGDGKISRHADGTSKPETPDMSTRMEMMEQRIEMMQMMMGQMMEHESESKKTPDHNHEN